MGHMFCQHNTLSGCCKCNNTSKCSLATTTNGKEPVLHGSGLGTHTLFSQAPENGGREAGKTWKGARRGQKEEAIGGMIASKKGQTWRHPLNPNPHLNSIHFHQCTQTCASNMTGASLCKTSGRAWAYKHSLTSRKPPKAKTLPQNITDVTLVPLHCCVES